MSNIPKSWDIYQPLKQKQIDPFSALISSFGGLCDFTGQDTKLSKRTKANRSWSCNACMTWAKHVSHWKIPLFLLGETWDLKIYLCENYENSQASLGMSSFLATTTRAHGFFFELSIGIYQMWSCVVQCCEDRQKSVQIPKDYETIGKRISYHHW